MTKRIFIYCKNDRIIVIHRLMLWFLPWWPHVKIISLNSENVETVDDISGSALGYNSVCTSEGICVTVSFVYVVR